MSRRWLWLVPPALAGTLLRCFLLARQIAGGDEAAQRACCHEHAFLQDPGHLSAVPSIYGLLAERGASTIVELPWPTSWRFGNVFPHYQKAHGLEVIVSPVAGVPA